MAQRSEEDGVPPLAFTQREHVEGWPAGARRTVFTQRTSIAAPGVALRLAAHLCRCTAAGEALGLLRPAPALLLHDVSEKPPRHLHHKVVWLPAVRPAAPVPRVPVDGAVGAAAARRRATDERHIAHVVRDGTGRDVAAGRLVDLVDGLPVVSSKRENHPAAGLELAYKRLRRRARVGADVDRVKQAEVGRAFPAVAGPHD
mmetsp:Transcript_16406/g.53463  ORF Transcript_16406/g.53463 Transcript_16406/m.53463 type:complete len:201 (-) Transcript_16406:530-1132(-)|eukprot:scaffold15872_cov122-Isochrysis_galbana.AAC.2